MNNRQGFTLFELVSATAIISVLCAILFPIFARARETSQYICARQEKQLGLAFLMYAQDYDAKLPTSTERGVHLGEGWVGKIYLYAPYAKNAELYQCPNDPYTAPAGQYPVSYSYNTAIPRDDKAPGRPRLGVGGAYAAMTDPAKTVLLCEVSGTPSAITAVDEGSGDDYDRPAMLVVSSVTDGNRIFNGSDGRHGGVASKTATFGTGTMTNGAFSARTGNMALAGSSPGRHEGGSNFLFVDGHVKWLHGRSVSPGYAALEPTNARDVGASRTGVPRAAGTRDPSHAYAATFSPI